MFTAKTPREASNLEKAIDTLLTQMSVVSCDSDEYAKMVVSLDKLYKLKEIDAPKRVSPDTLALIGGNIAGILLIIGHEKVNVITTKALGFVLKAR